MGESLPIKAEPEHEGTIKTAAADQPLPKEPESEPGPGPTASKWTKKRIVYLSLAVVVAVIIIVLVITLPVVLTRSRSHNHDHPSYRHESNRPKRVLGNFPDPGLIQANDGSWFAFATNSAINNTKVPRMPVAMSPDFTNWTKYEGYDALPTLGSWERKTNHFAPDVIQRVSVLFLPKEPSVQVTMD